MPQPTDPIPVTITVHVAGVEEVVGPMPVDVARELLDEVMENAGAAPPGLADDLTGLDHDHVQSLAGLIDAQVAGMRWDLWKHAAAAVAQAQLARSED